MIDDYIMFQLHLIQFKKQFILFVIQKNKVSSPLHFPPRPSILTHQKKPKC